jgi:DnaJ-class molecular chaperone
MSDYYEVLGLNNQATDDDIKKAYKRLAMLNHPDKGGDTTQFQRVQEAYETLGDKHKKAQYDNRNNQPDFFQSFFHQNHRKQKRADHYFTCNISLKDVYFGVTKKFKVTRTRMCTQCTTSCHTCNGSGVMMHQLQMGPLTQMFQQQCNRCSGSGQVTSSDNTCKNCVSGNVTEEKLIDLTLEKGVESGIKKVVPEWGEQATKSNEISGNLVITVVVDASSDFKRDGLDLLYVPTITFLESMIGKEIDIPLFDGVLKMNISGFGIIDPKKKYTVYDKGLIDKRGNKGHLHLVFNIEYPNITLENYQKDLIKKAFIIH